MEKEFNITGTCIPEMHYMVNLSDKLKEIIKLVEKGKYFIINRPRQYGKTTILYMLEKKLNNTKDYLVVEGIGDLIFEREETLVKAFLEILEDSLYLEHEQLAKFLENEKMVCNLMSFKP